MGSRFVYYATDRLCVSHVEGRAADRSLPAHDSRTSEARAQPQSSIGDRSCRRRVFLKRGVRPNGLRSPCRGTWRRAPYIMGDPVPTPSRFAHSACALGKWPRSCGGSGRCGCRCSCAADGCVTRSPRLLAPPPASTCRRFPDPSSWLATSTPPTATPCSTFTRASSGCSAPWCGRGRTATTASTWPSPRAVTCAPGVRCTPSPTPTIRAASAGRAASSVTTAVGCCA